MSEMGYAHDLIDYDYYCLGSDRSAQSNLSPNLEKKK